jgi:RNA polymerase sigma factor (sigma-70 family)
MDATLARLTRLATELARQSDGRLLDSFLGGSQPAFRELVTRHGALVYGVCNRILRQRQDAEDAFQAVFLVLARRAADVWPREAVGAWLYGVAQRVSLKARTIRARKKGREQALEDVAQPVTPVPEPDLAEVIDSAVRKLPEVYRAAVVACDLEGLSRAEAAEQLGWKEGTLSGRLARARKLLADKLRKAGLALPTGGLAAVLGTNTVVHASLTESVLEVVSGQAVAGVPAPVAALTEGVVQSMFLVKLKAAVAALMVACSVGLVAWAGVAGDSPQIEPGVVPGQATGQPLPKPVKPEPLRAADPQPLPPAKLSPGLDLLQGKWRVVGITTEGAKEVAPGEKDNYPDFEIIGSSLWMPYRDASSGWRREQYSIAVDDKQHPFTMNLVAKGKPAARGIYELTAPAKTCASCHSDPFDSKPQPPDVIGLCQPGLKKNTGMRLALGITGGRPAKFGGGEGVVEFKLARVPDDHVDAEQLTREKARIEAFLALMAEARAEADRAELVRLKLRLSGIQAKLDVEEARKRVPVALADLERAKAAVEVVTAHLVVAKQNLQAAEERLATAQKAAEKAVADVEKKTPATPAKQGESFTVHIRPLAAAEKVITVKATGKESVLEGLAYAAEDMALNAEKLSVWVVRDKKVMEVDLAAIQKGESKTNYTLKPGDQLFVQVKVGK